MPSSLGWYELLACGVLGTWFAVSVVFQFPLKRINQWRDLDPFGLIPHWSFFAPQPAVTDVHLLYRDQLADGTFTAWTEIPLLEPRRWWHAVWNPSKREKKALFDLATATAVIASQATPKALQVCVPYLLLLNYVSTLPRPPGGRATQFVLMDTQGCVSTQAPTRRLLSSLHALE